MGAAGSLLAMTAVSVLGTASSSYQQSKAQKSQGEYEKSIYETNARISQLQADDAIRRGESKANEHKKSVKRLIGSQRASLAAQGQDLEAGDALAIQEETAQLGALDALEIKNNAWREAWGYRVQANQYMGQARFADITSKYKSRQTLLTGGMNIAKDIANAQYLKEYSKDTTKRYK